MADRGKIGPSRIQVKLSHFHTFVCVSHRAISRSSQCSTTGVTKAVMKTIPYEVETSDGGSTVHFPGTEYSSSDLFGTLSPWTILKYLEGGRAVGLRAVSPLANMTYFVVAQRFEFNTHTIARAKHWTTFPFSVTLALAAVGRTSHTYRQTLVNRLDGSCVAAGSVYLVAIDPATRRPQEIPPAFSNKYQFVKPPSAVMNVPEVPAVHVCVPFVVRYSDTDRNKHLNQASCVKLAFDCVWRSNRLHPFHRFGQDFGKHPMTNISVLYKGEASEGDQVICSCWQDNKQPQHIHVVMKSRDKVIAYLNMTFDILSESKL